MELDFHKDPTLLTSIVDAMAVGVFTVDANGRFVSWSEGAERITGYARHEVVGQACHLLEGPNCKGFGKLADLLQAPDPPPDGLCNQECKIVTKSGRERYIHGSVRLIRDPQGQIAGAVGSFIDVTSLVHANEKIALLESQVRPPDRFGKLLGKSTAMQEAFRRLRLAADSDVTVLITGESGTGKELAARAIHDHSSRREKPFLALNCSAIPDTLLESELFGYAKGAFTGAAADRPGLFEAAEGGTLFLDEIGDVSPAIQVKLLRVLQEREIRRVGDSRTRPVDVRLITATHHDLRKLVADGTIREDFYYRIHVFEIRMPPLRDRKEDIPLLVDHFLRQRPATGKPVDGMARDALQLLQAYHWPGNVRQLLNALEHACVTVSGDRIGYLDLPEEIRLPRGFGHETAGQNWTDEDRAERDRILEALRQSGGNRTQAAKRLGTSRVTLWKKMSRYGIGDHELPSRSKR